MKIIQIMPEFGLAGAEIMCENLIYQQVKQGNQVVAISLYDYHSPITERLEAENIPVVYLGKKPGLDVSIIRKLIHIFKQERPDVIHTHRYVMQYAIPAAKIVGIKRRVHTIHSIAIKENERLARKLAKHFYHHNGVVPVALSTLIQDSVMEEYDLSRDRIPVIFNGINLDRCISKLSYQVGSVFTIVHIGRFMDAKNHMGLLMAFQSFHEKYPNTVLQLIGDGELRLQIEEYIREHNLESAVELLGLQSNVYQFLSRADMFTLPSLWEGIPMTLIEAMGTGLPIVTTNVGGIPDMLTDGESALIVDAEADQLAAAFEKCYLSETLRETLGQNAKMRSVEFSAEHMANEYLKVYQREV